MTEQFDSELGQEVRAVLAERGLTIYQLAKAVGMADTNLHRCFRTGRVSGKTIAKLSDALDVDLSRFATRGREQAPMTPDEVRQARHDAGLTQRELGLRLGHLDGAVVSQLESGFRPVTLSMYARLQLALAGA